jgi:hypothetical protein
MAGSADETLVAIAEAARGLLYPSETDAPLEAYRFPAREEPSPEALLRAEARDPGTPVEEASVEDFFAPLVTPREGATEAEIEDARRWTALLVLLARELADLRVYRVGAVDIDAFVIGKHEQGAWIGLRTRLVET